MVQQSVEGKRIVVTGASRGLGRAFAEALAAGGARLVINATNEDLLGGVAEGIRAGGGTVEVVAGSVADDAVAERLISRCVDRYGGIDVVVNNAGIVRDRTLMKMTPDEFDQVIAVNLRGTWSVSRHAARAMRDAEQGGLLLQIVSNSAFVGSTGQTNYAASKAGVMGMLYAWDVELARYQIRTNALWPVARTDMTEVVFDNASRRAAAEGKPPPTARELGFGEPAEVAKIIVHLCSDAASHLRSQLLTFNGSKLAIWQHPREATIVRRDHWDERAFAEVLADARAEVYVPEL